MARFLLIGAFLVVLITLIMIVKSKLQPSTKRDRSPLTGVLRRQGVLMFLLPLPVLIAALVSLAGGQLLHLVGNALGYGLFLSGAILLRRGLLSEAIPERRPPPTPGRSRPSALA